MSKQQISLFRIALEEVKVMIADGKDREVSNDEIINFIVNSQKGDRKASVLKFTKAVEEHFRPYSLKGYFANVPVNFNWAQFFENSLSSGHKTNGRLLNERKTYHKSFFIFIFSESSMYCFSGGLGYHYIKDFVDDNFGISVLESLQSAYETELTMTQTRSVVGSVASDLRVFRDSHRIQDENTLGKIYKTAAAKLPYSKDLEKLKKIIFEEKNQKKNVLASQSFCFSKSIEMKDLKSIVSFFDDLDFENKKFSFSQMRPMKRDRKYSKFKVEILNLLLKESAFDFLNGLVMKKKDTVSPRLYEMNHKDFVKFYQCNKFIISRKGEASVCVFDSPYGFRVEDVLRSIAVNDKEYLSDKIKEYNRLRSAPEKLKRKGEILSVYNLDCFLSIDEEERREINGKLTDYFTGEIVHGGKTYFYLDGQWYTTEAGLLESLNSEFSSIYSRNKVKLSTNPWRAKRGNIKDATDEDENTYLHNLATMKIKNTLIMHKVITSNIELCDFITWTKEDLFVCHVKPSFDGNIRILVNQIHHSCLLIQENLRIGPVSGCVLEKYFNKAKKYKGKDAYALAVQNQFSKMTFTNFYELFSKKNIHYVACIVDPSNRSLDKIEDFDSNIAKICTIDAYRSMKTITSPGSRFLIHQIKLA